MYYSRPRPMTMDTGSPSKFTRPLTEGEIRHYAPSVYAVEPWQGVSDRYTFIPTSDVLAGLLREGWQVMKATQQRTITPGKKEFTRHALRLRHMDAATIAQRVGDVFPEILLINSHDTGAAYQLHAGLFRLACLNGLVVADSTFARVSVRHSGQVRHEVLEGAARISADMPKLIEEVDRMKAITLEPNERGIFARAAIQAKYGNEAPEALRPEALLMPRRYGEDKKDAWTTLNVVQENLTKGGLSYDIPAHRDQDGNYVSRSRRHTRPIRAIDADTRVNKSIWQMMEALVALKAGQDVSQYMKPVAETRN